MKKVLYLLMALCITETVLSMDEPSLNIRAQRILQEPETYQIKPQADVKTYCSDKGLNPVDFQPSDEVMKTKRETMVNRYEGLYQVALAQGSGTGFSPISAASDAFKTSFGYAFIMCIVAAISLIFLVLWCLTSCCCKGTCCVSRHKEKRNLKCVNCIVVSGILIAVASVIVTIIWLVYMGRLTNRIDSVSCGLAIMKSDLINGAKINETRSFVGTEGFIFLIQDFNFILDDIEDIKSSAAEPIKALNLGSDAQAMAAKFETYRTGLNDSLADYEYPGTKNRLLGVKIPIASIYVINDRIGAIKEEVKLFNEAATNIAKGVDVITSYGDEEIQTSRDTFADLTNKLNNDVKGRLNSLFNFAVGDGDRIDAVKKSTVSAIIISACIVCVPLVLFVVILLLNHYNKCHCLKFLNKIIMLIQILWSTLVFAFAALMVALSLVVVVVCRIMAGVAVNENYLSINFSKINLGLFTKVVDQCVGPTADGNLLKALGVEMTDFNKQTTMNEGTLSFDKISADLNKYDDPPISKAFLNATQPFADLEKKDGPGTNDDEIDSGIQRVNSYKCSQDTMSYKGLCVSGSTRSTTSDASATTGLGSSFCFDVTQFRTPSSFYDGRYASATCTPTSGGPITNTEGERNLKDTLNAVAVYKTKMDLFITRFRRRVLHRPEGTVHQTQEQRHRAHKDQEHPPEIDSSFHCIRQRHTEHLGLPSPQEAVRRRREHHLL
jgi:hypothetical protein